VNVHRRGFAGNAPPIGLSENNMEAKIRELALLSALACVCLGFAWAYDEGMLAAVFAVEAAFAGIEAVYLSLRSRRG
jgi:hypothetical protein